MIDQTPETLEAAALLPQKFFDDNLDEVARNRRRFLWEGAGRRGAAYLLKAISIFAAIFVAAKIDLIPQTALGLIIAASVGLDQLTSNHSRLLAVVAAQHAADRLLAKVKLEHSSALPEIISLRNSGQQAAAIAKLAGLLSQLNIQIHNGKEAILDGVRAADLKSLDNLYVDATKSS